MKKNNYSKFFITMLIMVIFSALASMAPSFLLQIWEGQGGDINTKKIIFVVGLIVLTNLISIMIVGYRERFAEKYNEKNCLEQMEKLCGVKYDEVNNVGPSNYLEKVIGAVNSIYQYMTGTNIEIWSQIVIATISLCLVARVNWGLVVLMVAVVPIQVFGFKLLNKELNRRAMKMQQDTSAGFQELMSCIQQTDYIKQLASYDGICKTMKPSIVKMYSSMAQVNKFARTVSLALNSFTGIIQNVIVLIAVYSFYEGGISAYTLMILTLLVPLYFGAIRAITDANIDKKDFVVAQNLLAELDEKQEDRTGEKLEKVSRITLNVNKLKIGEKNIDVIVKGEVNKGEIVQIAGESGMGKSTLVKAILKFRESEGVKIDNFDLKEISRSSLREHVEYVSQNIPIIKGTLRDNLTWGIESDSYTTDESLMNSSILKTVFDNKKLDDYIDEGGANLSGGEKQKIAIARALLKKPEVLILDEVCSNIDRETAEEIYKIVRNGKNERLTIIISHDELPKGFVDKRIEIVKA